MGRSGLIILVAVLVALFGFARHSGPAGQHQRAGSAAFGGSGSVTAHLKVVPTIRSVTVSPGSVNFDNCTGRALATRPRQATRWGTPTGSAGWATPAPDGHFPVTVTYTGLAGNVWVSASGAVPRQRQRQLEPVRSRPASPPAPADRNQPGNDQFTIMTFAQDVAYYQMLTGDATCDTEFAASGECTAAPAQFQSLTAARGHPADRADGLRQ